MAKALSLVDAKGKPLLKHKDAHFDGTQEYGVKIDWEKIGGLERSQQAEVLKIFSTIKRGQIKDWKVSANQSSNASPTMETGSVPKASSHTQRRLTTMASPLAPNRAMAMSRRSRKK